MAFPRSLAGLVIVVGCVAQAAAQIVCDPARSPTFCTLASGATPEQACTLGVFQQKCPALCGCHPSCAGTACDGAVATAPVAVSTPPPVSRVPPPTPPPVADRCADAEDADGCSSLAGQEDNWCTDSDIKASCPVLCETCSTSTASAPTGATCNGASDPVQCRTVSTASCSFRSVSDVCQATCPGACPELSISPTGGPTRNPTLTPTSSPTTRPTRQPTSGPTLHPSASPSQSPAAAPESPTCNGVEDPAGEVRCTGLLGACESNSRVRTIMCPAHCNACRSPLARRR